MKIVEAEACPEHARMQLEIPPKLPAFSYMEYLKGRSSTMQYEQFGALKYKYRSKEFWCKGYYVDTAGKQTSRIAEYIRNWLKEAQLGEKLTMREFGLFTGSKQQALCSWQTVLCVLRICDDQRALPAYVIPRILRVDVY